MPRPSFASLPAEVRAEIDVVLGWDVTAAESQSGGWSPGVAARLRGSSGERAFCKAVSAEVNPQTPDMHRTEARLTGLLPPSLGAPRLLASFERAPWVVLLLEEVPGRPPQQPWDRAELAAALRCLDRLADVVAPPGFAPATEALASELGGWALLAADPPSDLGPWCTANLDRLVELESRWPEAASGDRLLHLDARGDNMLVLEEGPSAGDVVLVDWPWACAGEPVFDVVGFAPSVALHGGPPCDELLLSSRAGKAADRDVVDVLVCAVAGLFQHAWRQPPPPGIAHVRSFQEQQGRIATSWLAERLGW